MQLLDKDAEMRIPFSRSLHPNLTLSTQRNTGERSRLEKNTCAFLYICFSPSKSWMSLLTLREVGVMK